MRRTPLAPLSGARPTSLRRLLPAAALGAALSLTACQTMSPMQTDVPYAPGDGVPVDLGAVQLRDLVVVSGGKDKPGVLSGSLSNTSDQAQRVAFALPNAQPVYADAPPHSTARLSGSTQVQLPAVPVSAGDVVTLSIQSPGAPAAVVVVPVLAAQGYYATVAPTSVPTAVTATP